jgi:ATP-binding cassette subfamily B protein
MKRSEEAREKTKGAAARLLAAIGFCARETIEISAPTTALILLASALSAALNLSIPWALDAFARAAVTGDDLLPPLAVIALLALVIHPGTTLVRDFAWAGLCGRLIAKASEKGFSKALSMSAAWHADRQSGRVMRDVLRGATAMENLSDRIVYSFVPIPILFIGGAVGAFLHGGTVAAAALAFLLLAGNAIAFIHATRIVLPKTEIAADADSAVSGRMADALAGVAEIRASGAEPREEDGMRRLLDAWRRNATVAWNAGIIGHILQHQTLAVALVVILSLTAFAGPGALSPGDAAWFASTWVLLRASTINLGSEFRAAVKAAGEMRALSELLAETPGVIEAAEPKPFVGGAGRIDFVGVDFSYGTDARGLFRKLDVSFAPGSVTAIVGRSGSGKTTLVKLLLRLAEPTAGTILIDGADIASVRLRELRRAIALVPQEPVLFHRSVRENVAYGKPDASDAEIEEACAKARILDLVRSLPKGLDSVVGERGAKLSGGERQRVAIARALLSNRPILILDEATSALDVLSERLVKEAIEAASEGRTVIVIAHRLSTVRRAERIVVMDGGRIVESGNHDELISIDGIYAAMLKEGRDVIDAENVAPEEDDEGFEHGETEDPGDDDGSSDGKAPK